MIFQKERGERAATASRKAILVHCCVLSVRVQTYYLQLPYAEMKCYDVHVMDFKC